MNYSKIELQDFYVIQMQYLADLIHRKLEIWSSPNYDISLELLRNGTTDLSGAPRAIEYNNSLVWHLKITSIMWLSDKYLLIWQLINIYWYDNKLLKYGQYVSVELRS